MKRLSITLGTLTWLLIAITACNDSDIPPLAQICNLCVTNNKKIHN